MRETSACVPTCATNKGPPTMSGQCRIKGARSTSVGNAVQRDLTFTIRDGPAYSLDCATYGSANGAASEKFDATNNAVDAGNNPSGAHLKCPKCWQ
uniref:Uncharacterized protein n=1 Tax=Romanomermis culicivorax TaxID=13658 RepID=A0A915L5H1_ROMCU